MATPIGNLADLSLRALHVLDLVDAIACEDTRHTAGLLQAFGLHKPLLALHQHNEREAAQQVIERLRRGERVAFVSDAGTPGVSDPGARLCAEVAAQGLRCMPLPGASAVTTLLSVAGLTEGEGRFVFLGFLPAKGGERQRAVLALADQPLAAVLLEAPHRIAALARELAPLGERRLTIGRADQAARAGARPALRRLRRLAGGRCLAWPGGVRALAAPGAGRSGRRQVQQIGRAHV